MDRRKFINAVGGSVLAGIAGCTGGGDGEDGGGDDSTPTATAEPPDTEPNDDTPTDSEDTPTETQEPTDSPTPESRSANVAVGELVEGDNLSMVIRGVEETTQIGDFQEADEGNVFHIVRLVVKNTTQDRFINFSGFLQTSLKDSEGYNYSQTIASTGQTFQGGSLAPGEVSRGDIVFETPEDASGLTLQFDFQAFALFQFDRVVVNLENQAGTIADLTQNLQVDIQSPGDEVSYGDTAVTLNSVDFTTKIGSYAEAEEGNEFAVVDITTTNNSDEEKQISTLLQMLVKDDRGNSYGFSISGTTGLDRAYDESTPLGPGEERRGKMAYEVPADASQLYWIFEFTLWNDGDKTFWALK